MTKIFLAAGVAALAIAAPAGAKPDHERGKNRPAKVERGGGSKDRSARVERRTSQRSQVERRGGQQRVAMQQKQEKRRDNARVERRAQKVEVRQDNRRAARVERKDDRRQQVRAANRDDRRQVRAVNRDDRREVRAMNRDDRRDVRAINREARQDVRALNRADRRDIRFVNNDRDVVRVRQYGDGVRAFQPLVVKTRLVGQPIPTVYRERRVPIGLRDIYRDTDDYYWRYGDGYAYRVNRSDNLVAALLPLLGLGYTVGQPFPATYMNSYLPSYYQPFYQSYGDDYYRYGNGYIYEIDGRTGLIEDIDPAYGYGYGVGQMWPSSYDYYNVPLAYRDMYYDTPDYYYRYAPGSIYQVDRSSNLISAVASLLTGGMSVGQPLPVGYGAYNVPYAYRSTYYDTPDAWYRYNNGSIYRVDPTTQLVTALVRSLV